MRGPMHISGPIHGRLSAPEERRPARFQEPDFDLATHDDMARCYADWWHRHYEATGVRPTQDDAIRANLPMIRKSTWVLCMISLFCRETGMLDR